MKPQNTISTNQYSPSDRSSVWRELIFNHFSGLECDVFDNNKFSGSLDIRQAGAVTLINLEADPHKVIRTDALSHKSNTDFLKMIIPISGSAFVGQYNKEAQIDPGNWVIYDTSKNYNIFNKTRANYLIVTLPRERLAVGCNTKQMMASSINGIKGVSQLALNTLNKTWQELPYMDDSGARGSGEILIQLIKLALDEFCGKDGGLSRDLELRNHAIDTINYYIRDPSLNVEFLTDLLGCSKRRLYGVFQNCDKTINQLIQEQRLASCAKDLQSKELEHLSITDIAMSWGFNNPSYFSKLFRLYTGQQPREYRNQMLG